MKQYDKEKPLISIHIPKCAGTSFIGVLKEWFGKKLYLHYFDEKNNKMPPRYNLKTWPFRRKFKRGLCIHGHFNKTRGFGVMDYYPEVDQFITILREPFEIAVSNYFFVKKLGEESFRAGRPHRIEENLNDYLKKHNKSHLLLFMPYEMTMDNYEEILEKHFVYVGIAEDLQTSVDVLANKLGFLSVEVERRNIAERDEEVSEEVKQEFINNNQLEYAIYEWALRNYNQ